MPLDREDTLKKAEKLLRQGRLDNAIAEYLKVVEDQPRDWNTANTLGDLYARGGQPGKAVAQYARIAAHFFEDGFYPRAAAIYKKILKLVPDEESAQLKLADISVRLGLLKDAKTYYGALAARRRARGDQRGAEEIVLLLGSVDPSDVEARTAAARVLAGMGDVAGAAARFRELYADLMEKDREAEAVEALKQAVDLDPADAEGRRLLAKAALASGDAAAARGYLDRGTAGDDPALLTALLEIELEAEQFDAAAAILREMLALAPERRDEILGHVWKIAQVHPDAAFSIADAVVDTSIAAEDFAHAADVLQAFVDHVPAHIPALLKLVEVCVDGGLETAMYDTQAQLADAYLAVSQAAEARVIAEDLVAREPWEAAHIERFRRALVMLRVPEPDAVIAERLSGQVPFVATDHFWDPEPGESALSTPAASAGFGSPASQGPLPDPAGGASAAGATSAPGAASPVGSTSAGGSTSAAGSTSATGQAPNDAASPAAPAAAMAHADGGRGQAGAAAGDGMEFDLTTLLGELEAEMAPPVPATPASGPPAASPSGQPVQTPAPAPATQEGMEDVFSGMRSEAARTAPPDQSARLMTIARTYLEMGMTEDAIKTLTVASRSPQQRFEAGRLLGGLYRELRDYGQATRWLEQAAEVPPPDAEAGRALLYELAEVLEEAGETSRALAVLLELQAEAGAYRDAAARAARLARVQAGG